MEKAPLLSSASCFSSQAVAVGLSAAGSEVFIRAGGMQAVIDIATFLA